MLRIFQIFKDMKESAKEQDKPDCQEPKMSVKKWYELQQKLREEQMARARATE